MERVKEKKKGVKREKGNMKMKKKDYCFKFYFIYSTTNKAWYLLHFLMSKKEGNTKIYYKNNYEKGILEEPKIGTRSLMS